MIVKLSYIEHGCSDKHCGGEIIKTFPNSGVRIIRRPILTIPGIRIPRHFDTRDQALAWASKQGYEVAE